MDDFTHTFCQLSQNLINYQEYFDLENYETTVKTQGIKRPEGFYNFSFRGYDCRDITEADLLMASKFDYTNVMSSYPFMPLLPYASNILNFFVKDIVLSGLFISNLAFILSAILFYKLLKTDFDEHFSFKVVLLYILYPFNFILSGFLTEGLFNFLLFSTLYFARNRKYLLSALSGMFLSVNRVLGILILFPILFIYNRLDIPKLNKFILMILTIALVSLLLLIHLNHLHSLTGDWLVLINAQKAWGRVGDGIFGTLIKYLSTYKYYADIEFLTFLIALGLSIYTFYYVRTIQNKPLPVEYLIYTMYSFLIPMFSGSFASFPRYTLSIFVIYIGIAHLSLRYGLYKVVLLLSFIASLIFFSFWSLHTPIII